MVYIATFIVLVGIDFRMQSLRFRIISDILYLYYSQIKKPNWIDDKNLV